MAGSTNDLPGGTWRSVGARKRLNKACSLAGCLGLRYLRAGCRDDAMASLETALRLGPSNIGAHYYRGIAPLENWLSGRQARPPPAAKACTAPAFLRAVTDFDLHPRDLPAPTLA